MADEIQTIEQVNEAIKAVHADKSLSGEKQGEMLLPLYKRLGELEKAGTSQNANPPPAHDGYGFLDGKQITTPAEPIGEANQPSNVAPELAELKNDLGIGRGRALGEILIGDSGFFPTAEEADRFVADAGLSPARQRNLLIELDAVINEPFRENDWLDPDPAWAKTQESLKNIWREDYPAKIEKAQSLAGKIPGFNKWLQEYGFVYDSPALTRIYLALARL